MNDAPTFDVVASLRPVRRRIGLGRMERFGLRGLIAGALAACLLLALTRLVDLGAPRVAALALLPAGVLLGLLAALRAWPGELEAARTVDRHFGLHDRVTTALDLRSAGAPLATLQRTDLAARVRGMALGASGRGRIDRREAAAAGIVTAAVLALLVMGTSTSARPQRVHHTTDTQRIRHATSTIPGLQRRLGKNLLPGKKMSQVRKLEAALSALRKSLAHTTSTAAALRRISLTQAQLRRVRASLHPISPAAAGALNRSLQRSNLANRRSSSNTSPATTAGAQALAAQRLSALARALQHMSPAQRRALAKTLARASNATGDRSLRSALQRAASSLGYNDPRSAASALRSAATALGASAGESAAQQRLGQADSELQNLKSQISGVGGAPTGGTGKTPSSTSSAGGKSGGSAGTGGKGSGRGSNGRGAGGQGSASGSGRGNGRSGASGAGSGQGSGRGTGTGRGTGKGTGHGAGVGSHGNGGGQGGAGPSGSGHYATVYIPGHEGTGPQQIRTGPKGQPLPGAVVPYQQVIGQYAGDARAALDRSSLTPAQRAAVKRYFVSISR